MLTKPKYIVAALILLSTCGYAAIGDIGTEAGQFLKLGAGARASGMGDAYTAICDDSSAIYYNPAGLNNAGNFGITLMHAIWFEGVSYEWAGVNMSLGNMGKVGIGAQYVSYGSIIETDSTGLDTGSFAPSDLSASLSYANNMGDIDLGVTARYISMTVKQSAAAFAFDAGVILKLIRQTNTKLNIGIMASNFGGGINFGSLNEQLASTYKAGIGYSPEKNIMLSAEVCFPGDNGLYFAAGGEYALNTGSDLEMKVRAGYNTRNVDTGGLSGFTVGLGLGNKEYGVDYAFVPFGILGYTHRVSFTVAFGKNGSYPVVRKRFESKAREVKEVKKVEEVVKVKEEKEVNESETGSKVNGVKEVEKVEEVKEGLKEQKQEVTGEKNATPEVKPPAKTEAPQKKETQEDKRKRLQEWIRKSLKNEK